jgi:signal transduction histidine kinase
MKDSLLDTTTSTFENMGLEIGNEIERLVNDGRDNIVILANNPILRSENETTSEKHEQLDLTHRYYEIYDDITLLDTTGRVITSATYNYRGEWSTNEWYKRSLNGSVVVSDAHIILNPWKVVQIFLSPISNKNDEIIGVVAGQIDMTEIWEITDSISIGETGFVYLINNDGKIIAHPDKSHIFTKLTQNHAVNNVLQNITGTASYTDEFGSEMICSYMPILADTIYDNNGCWGVIVAQQSDEVFASVYSFQQQQMIVTTLIIVGIVLCVSLIFSRNIIKPIHKLEDGMKKVAAGNLEHHVDIKSGDEIEYLASSFNKMTDDLNVLNKELESKVQERTAEVSKLLEQKNEIIHMIGHDLKNPLGPLFILLPIVEGKVEDPKLKEMLQVSIRNVKSLKEMLFKTLEFAKQGELGMKVDFSNICLNENVSNLIESRQVLFTETNVAVENKIDEKIMVNADKLLLDEVFDNLFTNAVKYSQENGGMVTVDALEENDFVKVSVKDTGIGLTEEQLGHIFDKFYKNDDVKHIMDSHGLGLSICKHIVEKHGGKIWAESQGEGKGTTMFFTIPTSSKT